MAKDAAKQRRAHFQTIERAPRSQGTCTVVGKQIFNSRSAAKKYGRKTFPGEKNLSAYECGDHFHFGHLPDDIVAGKRDRGTLTHRKVLNPPPVVVPDRDPIEFPEVAGPARIPSPAELAARRRAVS